MTSLRTKLALSAVGLALIATPAFAQKHHMYRQESAPAYTDQGYVGTYPNGAARTGTAESVESGAEFNLSR
jgi:hypothetical protein